jgi:hypothetical protein
MDCLAITEEADAQCFFGEYVVEGEPQTAAGAKEVLVNPVGLLSHGQWKRTIMQRPVIVKCHAQASQKHTRPVETAGSCP